MADTKKLSVPTNPARALRELNNQDNNTTALQNHSITHQPTEQLASQQASLPLLRRPRPDGRTSRPRQPTADLTMVTSIRLAVGTLEQLDEFCWHNRCRKQDVVQAALDLYFAHVAETEAP